MFGLWKKYRWRQLTEQPVPDAWLDAVTEYIPIFPTFSDDEARGFLDHLKVLMWDKHWIGARDFELDETTKVVIASQAARMARRLPLSAFDRHSEFIVYGEDFVNPDDEMLPGPLHGEAHHFGTVVLSWPAVREGLKYPCQGYNPILHEMAHILDMTSGYFDGTPLLHSGKDYEPWANVCQKYFTAMRDRPEESFMDLYGAGDESEFFAVTTEAFFELPDVLAHEAPDLYDVFRSYYRVEPKIIPCSCTSHEPPEGDDPEDYEEVGYPLIPPPDPMENFYF